LAYGFNVFCRVCVILFYSYRGRKQVIGAIGKRVRNDCLPPLKKKHLEYIIRCIPFAKRFHLVLLKAFWEKIVTKKDRRSISNILFGYRNKFYMAIKYFVDHGEQTPFRPSKILLAVTVAHHIITLPSLMVTFQTGVPFKVCFHFDRPDRSPTLPITSYNMVSKD